MELKRDRIKNQLEKRISVPLKNSKQIGFSVKTRIRFFLSEFRKKNLRPTFSNHREKIMMKFQNRLFTAKKKILKRIFRRTIEKANETFLLLLQKKRISLSFFSAAAAFKASSMFEISLTLPRPCEPHTRYVTRERTGREREKERERGREREVGGVGEGSTEDADGLR